LLSHRFAVITLPFGEITPPFGEKFSCFVLEGCPGDGAVEPFVQECHSVMDTLYDTLDIRPDDDAGRVKDAFRKAVKANHPDLNVGDPDASARLMQVVRAKAILDDPELRAVYDRMLEFEHQQLYPTSRPTTILDTTRNIVPDAIVIVVLAVVLAGAYTLFNYIPETSAAKVKSVEDTAHERATVAAVRPPPPVDATASDSTRDRLEGAEAPVPSAFATTANGGAAVEDAAHEPATVAVVRPPPPVDTTASDSPRERLEGAKAPVPSTVAATANNGGAVENAAPATRATAPTETSNVVEAIAANGLAASPPLKDAKFYRERGIASYRNSDFPLAIADFDMAIQLDPNFEGAYIDRSIALYRMREFDRAFADVAQAMRIENSHRTEIPPLPKARRYQIKN
jgi:DnaJ domain